TAEETLKLIAADLPQASTGALAEPCWLLSQSGEARRALALLDRSLYAEPGEFLPEHTRLGLQDSLLHRAYLHAALEARAEAETAVTEALGLSAAEPWWYNAYGPACLMQGFLCERRGDVAGAQAAWKRGRVKAWRKLAPRRLADDLAANPNLGAMLPDL